MTREPITERLIGLASTATRAEAAQALACEVGAESMVLLVRDAAVDAMLPAAGFPRTLRGGPSWRAFVRRCTEPGIHRGEVEFPAGCERPVVALCANATAALFLGGHVRAEALARIEALMPLLAALLVSEQEVQFARSEANDARALASRSEALAAALEAARSEHARLNSELREQNRRKDDFLAMLGHELRNPLAPLVFSIELLRRSRDRDAQEARQLEVMLRQVRQLSRLVDDLLDISRVSHGRIELHRRAVSLPETVGDAIEAARPTLRAMGHDIEICIGDEDLVVNGDAVRLTQVVSNILHNAAKYTPPGGRIELYLYREDDNACVRVVDNGIGIDAAMLPRVFDLFTQAPGALERSQGGLGIGLTLVKSLVELHGGRVVAESAGLGKGSSFTVKLPLAAAPVAQDERAVPLAAPQPSRPISMLVVDDNRDAADSIAQVARAHGHRVAVAYGGLEALQMGPDLQPDLVVLDIGMPEMNGYELARRLRRLVQRKAIFVAVTGYGMARDRALSREAGFDEHRVKPLAEKDLLELIERVGRECSMTAG